MLFGWLLSVACLSGMYYVLGLQRIPLFGIRILGYLNKRIPNCLLTLHTYKLAIACCILTYLAIVHLNYCLGFSTCLHYELTNYPNTKILTNIPNELNICCSPIMYISVMFTLLHGVTNFCVQFSKSLVISLWISLRFH